MFRPVLTDTILLSYRWIGLRCVCHVKRSDSIFAIKKYCYVAGAAAASSNTYIHSSHVMAEKIEKILDITIVGQIAGLDLVGYRPINTFIHSKFYDSPYSVGNPSSCYLFALIIPTFCKNRNVDYCYKKIYCWIFSVPNACSMKFMKSVSQKEGSNGHFPSAVQQIKYLV